MAVVDAVWERDGGACARCGKPLNRDDRGRSYSIHHRVGRGAGGTRNPAVNTLSHLVTLCGDGVTGCHGWVESNRSEAYDTGWLVRRLGVTPATEIPVLHARFGMVRLTDDPNNPYEKEDA